MNKRWLELGTGVAGLPRPEMLMGPITGRSVPP
ncbi:MAG: hypothetical protein QOH54_435 [Mycobacterium sp.]|jgi:hypothetical protein|nr:hypothetical protein [Mycobacterium sp.]